MTLLVYCGEKTCVFNKKGKCANFKIALNEQGICMGYSPLIMPNISMGKSVNEVTNIMDSENIGKNPIGFGG